MTYNLSDEDILTGLKSRSYAFPSGATELYSIGELAKALGREVVTVRKWETDGTIPLPIYVKNGSDGKHGRRRLYSAAQICGMVRIANEEGIHIDQMRPRKGQRIKQIQRTRFTERVTALFDQELRKLKEQAKLRKAA